MRNITVEPGWTHKEAAAKQLGVSIRQLENLAALGRIRKNRLPRQAHERSARVLYRIEDLDAIKEGKPNISEQPSKALAVVPKAPAAAADPFAGFAAQLAALARAFPPPAAAKPWLTLKEAAAHTGLPARWLRDQARAGKLRAENVGDKRERWMFPRAALS